MFGRSINLFRCAYMYNDCKADINKEKNSKISPSICSTANGTISLEMFAQIESITVCQCVCGDSQRRAMELTRSHWLTTFVSKPIWSDYKASITLTIEIKNKKLLSLVVNSRTTDFASVLGTNELVYKTTLPKWKRKSLSRAKRAELHMVVIYQNAICFNQTDYWSICEGFPWYCIVCRLILLCPWSKLMVPGFTTRKKNEHCWWSVLKHYDVGSATRL